MSKKLPPVKAPDLADKYSVTVDVTPVVNATKATGAFFKKHWLSTKAKIHEATK